MKVPVKCPNLAHERGSPGWTDEQYARKARCSTCGRLVGDLPGTLWMELAPEGLPEGAKLQVLYQPPNSLRVQALTHPNDGATP